MLNIYTVAAVKAYACNYVRVGDQCASFHCHDTCMFDALLYQIMLMLKLAHDHAANHTQTYSYSSVHRSSNDLKSC